MYRTFYTVRYIEKIEGGGMECNISTSEICMHHGKLVSHAKPGKKCVPFQIAIFGG